MAKESEMQFGWGSDVPPPKVDEEARCGLSELMTLCHAAISKLESPEALCML